MGAPQSNPHFQLWRVFLNIQTVRNVQKTRLRMFKNTPLVDRLDFIQALPYMIIFA